MKTSEYIEDKINKLPKGYVFTYMDFMNEVTRREAIIKHLNRMATSGKINKLSKGKYFKPQIGKREIRPSFKRGRFRISFIKQKNTINKENIPLLRLLDAIRYIKKIPDTTVEKSCIRLMALLRELKTSEHIKLIKLAFKYSPATRALLGVLLREIDCKVETEIRDLQDSLNPITVYNFDVSEKVLSNSKYWNIK